MMTMVFATIFFSIILLGALASLAFSLDEAAELLLRRSAAVGAAAAPRRRIRVKARRAVLQAQSLRAAA